MNASLRTRSLWLAAGLAAVLSAPAFAQPQAPAAPAAAPKAPAAAAAPKAPAAPQPGDEICDPTCGSGSLLMKCGRLIRQRTGARKYALYGQEAIGSTWALATPRARSLLS